MVYFKLCLLLFIHTVLLFLPWERFVQVGFFYFFLFSDSQRKLACQWASRKLDDIVVAVCCNKLNVFQETGKKS